MRRPSQEEIRNAFHLYEKNPSPASIAQLVSDIKAKLACDTINKLENGKKLMEVGMECFENEEAFVDWLFNFPFFSDRRAPIEYLSDDNGAQIVIDLILSMEHGIS